MKIRKKVVAREWLYLLGFGIAGILAGLFFSAVARPPHMEAPPDRPPRRISPIGELGLRQGSEYSKSLNAYIPPAVLDSLRTMLKARYGSKEDLRDSSGLVKAEYLTVSLDAREEAAANVYADYLAKCRLVDRVKLALMLLTYPAFLLFRTVRWSIRQVRAKDQPHLPARPDAVLATEDNRNPQDEG